MLKIYLDNCCFNRPYDDQNQLRIEIETKAKLRIQKLIADKKVELVISYILELENKDNPYMMRRIAIEDFFKYAVANIDESYELLSIAQNVKQSGLKAKDSLHIASAIVAKCDYLLSTDDRLLKYKDDRISIIDPVKFILLEEALINE